MLTVNWWLNVAFSLITWCFLPLFLLSVLITFISYIFLTLIYLFLTFISYTFAFALFLYFIPLFYPYFILFLFFYLHFLPWFLTFISYLHFLPLFHSYFISSLFLSFISYLYFFTSYLYFTPILSYLYFFPSFLIFISPLCLSCTNFQLTPQLVYHLVPDHRIRTFISSLGLSCEQNSWVGSWIAGSSVSASLCVILSTFPSWSSFVRVSLQR